MWGGKWISLNDLGPIQQMLVAMHGMWGYCRPSVLQQHRDFMVNAAPCSAGQALSYTCLYSFLAGKANCLAAKAREASQAPMTRGKQRRCAHYLPSFSLLLFCLLPSSLPPSLPSFLLCLYFLLGIFIGLCLSLSTPPPPPQMFLYLLPTSVFAEKQKVLDGDEQHSPYCFSGSYTK